MAYHSAIPVGQQPPPSASRNRRPRTARPALVLLLCICARGEVTCRDTPPPARGPPPRAATHLARTARLARSRSFGEPIHAPASPVAAPFITCANAHTRRQRATASLSGGTFPTFVASAAVALHHGECEWTLSKMGAPQRVITCGVLEVSNSVV